MFTAFSKIQHPADAVLCSKHKIVCLLNIYQTHKNVRKKEFEIINLKVIDFEVQTFFLPKKRAAKHDTFCSRGVFKSMETLVKKMEQS